MFAQDFGHLCRGTRFHTSGHSGFWNSEQSGSTLHLHLSVRRYGVDHSQVAFQWHPLLLLLSFETQTSRVQKRQHGLQSRLLQCLLGVRLVLNTSEILILTPHFLGWQMSISVAKWTFFLSLFCASRKNLLLALYFVQLPGWNGFELLPFRAPLLLSHLELSSLEA